jgi:hypothetical protein
MGIYESEDGRFFISTYDPDPTNWTKELTPKGEVDTIAALKIQKWWRQLQTVNETEEDGEDFTEKDSGFEESGDDSEDDSGDDSGYSGDIDNMDNDSDDVETNELPVSQLNIFNLVYLVMIRIFGFLKYLTGF